MKSAADINHVSLICWRYSGMLSFQICGISLQYGYIIKSWKNINLLNEEGTEFIVFTSKNQSKVLPSYQLSFGNAFNTNLDCVRNLVVFFDTESVLSIPCTLFAFCEPFKVPCKNCFIPFLASGVVSVSELVLFDLIWNCCLTSLYRWTLLSLPPRRNTSSFLPSDIILQNTHLCMILNSLTTEKVLIILTNLF